MAKPGDDEDPFAAAERKKKEAAFEVLKKFVSDYEPAPTADAATTLLTTSEIQQSIKQHTGYFIETPDVFELMQNMSYKYEAVNGMEFMWLLKKNV